MLDKSVKIIIFKNGSKSATKNVKKNIIPTNICHILASDIKGVATFSLEKYQLIFCPPIDCQNSW